MDAPEQAQRRGRVVGILALVLALLFGATIGAASGQAGAGHHPLGRSADRVAWSDGPDGQHPFVLHSEGGQVETPDVAGAAIAHSTSLTAPTHPVSSLDDRPSGARVAPAPQRAELQVWRT